jgi:predicted polyphosphate/ATP-dependent NAD kinase
MMRDMGVSCIVTLGGDGTNRVVSKGCGDVPLVPLSTGTNNVFPQMVEGTLAGMAAGAIATGIVAVKQASRRSKRLDVLVDGELSDLALVDAAVSRQMFVGARAVWEPQALESLFLTRAEPASIGLSSIGSRLRTIAMDDPLGLFLRFDGEPDETASTVIAPVAPGLVSSVEVAGWEVMQPGSMYPVRLRPGTLALDGEREVELLRDQSVEVSLCLDGPVVIDIGRTHELMAGAR